MTTRPPDRGHQQREERHRSPLPRRDPDAIAEQQHGDQAAVGGIEDVFAAKADDELAGDGDDRGEQRQSRVVGAQQQAEREARDERALPVGRPALEPVAGGLRGEHGGQQQRRAPGGDVELEPSHAVDEQGGQRRNLIQPRVHRSSSSLRTIERGFLAGVAGSRFGGSRVRRSGGFASRCRTGWMVTGGQSAFGCWRGPAAASSRGAHPTRRPASGRLLLTTSSRDLAEPRTASPRPVHLTNTFGIIANGSPRRKTRSGAVSVVSARRSFRPRKADSSALRSEAPNGLAIDS